MNRIGKRIVGVLTAAAASLMLFCIPALAGTPKDFEDTAFITREQYEQILQVLRDCRDDDTSGETTIGHPTGIYCETEEEARKLGRTFKDLFQGEARIGMSWSAEGNADVTFALTEDNVYGLWYRSWTVPTEGGRKGTLYVGWLPGTDPAKCLVQNDEACGEIQKVLAGAPKDDEGFYRYFFDWLCNHVAYDETYALPRLDHSGYAAMVRHLAICDGYSKAYMRACWETGRRCMFVTRPDGDGAHSENVVWQNGTPKWMDATNGDQDTWIDYRYYMKDLDSSWHQWLFETPYYTED